MKEHRSKYNKLRKNRKKYLQLKYCAMNVETGYNKNKMLYFSTKIFEVESILYGINYS